MTAESEHFHSTLCNVLSQATELLKRHDAVQAFDILGPALTRVSQIRGGGGATTGNSWVTPGPLQKPTKFSRLFCRTHTPTALITNRVVMRGTQS